MSFIDGIVWMAFCVFIIWVGVFVDPTRGFRWNLKHNWPPLVFMMVLASAIVGLGA